MPINWFTVFAQAINFLILVWLLKRFLFKPILNAIDAREKGIAVQLTEAESKKVDAQKERDDFQHKNEAFDQERGALLKKATDDANAERQRLLDKARQDADTLRAKRQDALQNEQHHLSQEIIRRTHQEVFALTRKTLADLANTSLEERMVEVFIQRLRTMASADKDQLVAALNTSPQSARVRSAFDLPPGQRDAIQSAIKETLVTEVQVPFETLPDLIGGIELAVNGQKIGWSITDYLSMLEKSASELLHDDDEPASALEPKHETQDGQKPEPNHEPVIASTVPKADH